MDLAKHWRLRGPRYRLEGQRHTVRGDIRFPPEPTEAGEGWEPYDLKGTGTVYSFSVVRQAPDGYEAPYVLAMVALDEGPVVTAQITDCEIGQIEIGMPVEMVTRRLRDLGPEGLIVYGYKFRPTL
jgi:hypothetical protein